MSRKDKNINIFSHTDRDEIELILIKIVREMQRSLDNLPNPKKYSPILLAEARSNITQATILLLSLSFSLGPDEKLDPKWFRKRIALEDSKPYQVTSAFQRAVKEGAYTKVEEYKRHKLPGRPKASDNISYRRTGGRPPNTYQISKGLLKLKKIMSTKDTNKIIHDRLKQEGILQEYYRFLILILYHSLKKEGSTEGVLFREIKTVFPNYLKNVIGKDEKIDINLSSWKSFTSDVFLKYDEGQFESFVVPKLVTFLVESQLDYCSYFLKVLPKL